MEGVVMREKMPRVIKIALVLSFLSIVIEVAAPIVHEGVFIKNFLNYASGHDHKYVAMFGPCVKITEILVTGFLVLYYYLRWLMEKVGLERRILFYSRWAQLMPFAVLFWQELHVPLM